LGLSLLDTLQGAQLAQMEPELRLTLCKACVRITIHQTSGDLFKTVPLLFKLLQLRDKQLRCGI
jgi:hypothetical protein